MNNEPAMDWNTLVSTVFSKETAIGGIISGLFGIGGWAAIGRRFWSNNKAQIANNDKWTDTLDKQANYIDRLEKGIEARDAEIEKKDELLRKYYEDLATTKAELKIIQNSQEYLTQKVDELTKVNQSMAEELSRLRSELGATR
jgi:DNA repair exonuclease SbcCD ATPase subunit